MNMQTAQRTIVEFGLNRPKTVIIGALVITMILTALIATAEIDTDPENMLPSDDSVRVLNHSIRTDYGTSDMIALGIINESGVLPEDILGKTEALVEEINSIDGVVPGGVISFASPGAPTHDAVAEAVANNPLLAGKVISPDGKGLALYIPIESKSEANGVSSDIKELLEKSEYSGLGETYLAGLPLAEEKFGRDMFIQMAVLAPLAGGLVFLLMYYFFRRLMMVVAAMSVAMLSVMWTMGLLSGTGFPLHIMSSMIPIFLMPIAILDSIHILSEFFDRYPHFNDRRATLKAVYQDLFSPITYTTLTTAVAFSSLALTPIPPVQIFGLFTAFGVVSAWALTMIFVPAFVMLLNEERLQQSLASNLEDDSRILNGGLRKLRGIATSRPYIIPIVFIILAGVAIPGLMKIEVNDNPVRWFKGGSEIRVATEELTNRFPGTYNATLLLKTDGTTALTDPDTVAGVSALQGFWSENNVVGLSTSYADVVGSDTGSQGTVETALSSQRGIGSLITDNLGKANVQLLLKSGDNQAMQTVVDRTDAFLVAQPLPAGVTAEWGGETYLNLVWQDKMVTGMFKAFMATFGVVFVLLVVLFRSVRWAVLAMLPLSISIVLVYGAMGFMGRDYDMPLAVLSTLALGIAVDFAIHFIQRYREIAKEPDRGPSVMAQMFEEPGRAITRNALIVALGFLPMLFASLLPYVVVAALMSSIMVLSWLVSLVLLPALIALFNKEHQVAVG